MLRRVFWWKLTDISEILATVIMEAASSSKTSVNFYHQTTLRNIPEDSHLHTRRRENLKSHLYNTLSS
jgi:hypothetical protein